MIINTSSSVRNLDEHQQASEKRTKEGDASSRSQLQTGAMPDEAISPQAQLVQHMIDAWQSKSGTLSGKILTELEKTEGKDKGVLIDMMQTLERHEQGSVLSAGQNTAVDYDVTQLNEFSGLLHKAEPEGTNQQDVSRMLFDAIEQLSAHEPVATRDIIAPQSPPVSAVNKEVIPVHIPELEGVVSDACFELTSMPSLVNGGFESLAAW